MKFCSRQRALRGKRSAFLLLAATLFLTRHSHAGALCPTTIENDPAATADGCGVLLNISPNLSVQPTATGTLAYNGGDSTFGIINNSNSALLSLFLAGGNAPITNFTGEGISTYVSANGVAIPTTPPIIFGYEDYYGPSTTFSQVDSSHSSLLVNFTGGLVPGASTYFSLPGDPVSDVNGLTGPNGAILASAATSIPEPGSLFLAILAALAIGFYALFRKAALRCNALRASAVSRRRNRSLVICMLILGTLMSVSAARASDIITLPSNPDPAQLADAKQQLLNGTLVAMTDASPATFSGDFNVGVPLTQTSPDVPLRYCVIAAHLQASGSIHTYVGPQVLPGQTGLSTCLADLQTWVNQEGLLQDSPVAIAWTELSINTVSTKTGNGNALQETLGVYRANSSNTQTDYYMITKQVDSTPHYGGCLWGGTCGWLTSSRNLTIQTDIPPGNGYKIFDHGPLSVNGSTTSSFSVGAGVSGLGGTGSASYSRSWSQQDVSTTDTTILTSNVASWHDGFNLSFTTDPPAADKGLWESDQAVIYAVPVGTASFNVTANDTANFRWDNGFGYKYDPANLKYFVVVYPPSLAVNPGSLMVLPGQKVSFNISAAIPSSTGESLAWTITNIPDELALNTTTGSGSQTIQFQVSASAAPGPLKPLNINTTPIYAAPEVRTGPLQLPITVVSSSAVPPGVLITGGTNWNNVPTSSAEVWTPATQKTTSLGYMNQARVFHTATAIANAQIFLAGGLADFLNFSGTTELYNEATQRFAVGPSLQVPRAFHTATLLNDGTVLLVGGEDSSGNALASAEIYDPVGNTTALVGSMSVGRMKQTATLLPDSTVLIVGGASSSASNEGLPSAEIYHPQTKTFSMAGALDIGFQSQAATLLTNGQVLIAGGEQPTNGISNVEIYTPAAGTFSRVYSIVGDSNSVLATLPGDSAVLLGRLAVSSDLWSPSLWSSSLQSFTFETIVPEVIGDRPAAFLLQNTNSNWDGYLFMAGGVTANTGNSNGTTIYVLNTNDGSWTPVGAMSTARSGHTATLFGTVPASSEVALSSSLNPSITGKSVTFTAVVSGSGSTPTGSVTFYDGTTALGTVALNAGTAPFATSKLAIGKHAITAVYIGDSGFAGSTSPVVTQAVNPALATPAFSSLTSSQTIASGTSTITLSGILSAPGPVYPAAKENILITIGDVNATTAVGANGAFSLTNFPAATLTAGIYSITYSYAGDAKLLGANDSSTMLTVEAATSTTALRSSTDRTVPGQPFNLIATVSSSSGTPTGTVTFMDGTTVLGSAPLKGGQALLAITTLASGTHQLTAVYGGGTPGYAGSTSPAVRQIVLFAAAFSELTPSQGVALGTPDISLSGVVSATGPTYPATNEKVYITIGGINTTAAIGPNGTFSVANVPTGTLKTGTYPITYEYPGSLTLLGATDASKSLTVNNQTTAFSNLTPSQVISLGTASINLSGKIAAGTSFPTGSVSITINGVSTPAAIGANGVFSTSLDTHAIPASTTPYPITYSYPGGGNFNPASDATTTLLVNNTSGGAAATTTTITASVQQCITDSPFQLFITVVPTTSALGVPSGQVSLTRLNPDGSKTPLLQFLDANGQWNPALNGLSDGVPPGNYTYVATYQGSQNFEGSSAQLTMTCTAQ